MTPDLPEPPQPTPGVPLPPPEDGLPCAVFVEMVTEYLDGAIPADLRARPSTTSRSATGAGASSHKSSAWSSSRVG